MLAVPVPIARRDVPATLAAPRVLHLALTRSAVARLAPVADALPGPQSVVELSGYLAPGAPVAATPMSRASELAPAAVGRAVASAIELDRPEVVLVAGDSDAALAAALAATRAGVPVARVGAGLRCGDRGAPREINRIALDGLATRLYTDGEYADEVLRAEGIAGDRICVVGSTLAAGVDRWRRRAKAATAWTRFGLRRRSYVLVSLNRPESYGDPRGIVSALVGLGRRYPLLVCTDEQTRSAHLSAQHLERLAASNVHLIRPRDHVDFLCLQSGAGAVLTDSSGIQEETTALGVACFTFARASERSLTLTHGTNWLVGDEPGAIADVRIEPFDAPLEPLPLWDGDAGQRIADDLGSAMR